MKRALLGIGLLSLLFCTLAATAAGNNGETSTNRKGDAKYFELDELTKRAVDRSAAELIEEANGDLTLAFNGSHQHVYMARLGVGGEIETYCATSEKAVRRFLFERPVNEERGLWQ